MSVSYTHLDSQGKIYKMLSFAGYEHTHRLSEAGDVADPWYTGDFEATYQEMCIRDRGEAGNPLVY